MSPDAKNHITIEITSGTILRAVFVILLLAFIFLVRDILALIIFSVVIASAIEPLIHWSGQYRIPRLLTVISVYLVAFLILSFLFYLLVPLLYSEFSDFVANFSTGIQEPGQIQTFFGLAPNLPSSLSGILSEAVLNLEKSVEEVAAGFFSAARIIFGGALSFVLIIILSFYLAVQDHGIEKFLKILTPVRYEDYLLDLWKRSQQKIGRWLQGQILLGLMVGVFVFLGLTLLGVKYALMFALLSAVLELIPIFGPIISALPAIGVAFLQSPSLALSVAVLYIIIQQFENHLIYPLVVRQIVGIPSILVIIALIVGGKLGGPFGMLLAVPITVVLVEILNDFAAKKHPIAN